MTAQVTTCASVTNKITQWEHKVASLGPTPPTTGKNHYNNSLTFGKKSASSPNLSSFKHRSLNNNNNNNNQTSNFSATKDRFQQLASDSNSSSVSKVSDVKSVNKRDHTAALKPMIGQLNHHPHHHTRHISLLANDTSSSSHQVGGLQFDSLGNLIIVDRSDKSQSTFNSKMNNNSSSSIASSSSSHNKTRGGPSPTTSNTPTTTPITPAVTTIPTVTASATTSLPSKRSNTPTTNTKLNKTKSTRVTSLIQNFNSSENVSRVNTVVSNKSKSKITSSSHHVHKSGSGVSLDHQKLVPQTQAHYSNDNTTKKKKINFASSAAVIEQPHFVLNDETTSNGTETHKQSWDQEFEAYKKQRMKEFELQIQEEERKIKERFERMDREQEERMNERQRKMEEREKQMDLKLKQMQQEYEAQREKLRLNDQRGEEEKRLDDWFRKEEAKRLDQLQEKINREEQRRLSELTDRLEQKEAEEIRMIEQKIKDIKKQKRQTQAYKKMVNLHRKSMTPQALSKVEENELEHLKKQVTNEEKAELQKLEQMLHIKKVEKKELLDREIEAINHEQEQFIKQQLEKEKELLKKQMQLKHEQEIKKNQALGKSKPVPPPKPPADSIIYNMASNSSSQILKEPPVQAIHRINPNETKKQHQRSESKNGMGSLVQKALRWKRAYLDVDDEYMENRVASTMLNKRIQESDNYWDDEEYWYH